MAGGGATSAGDWALAYLAYYLPLLLVAWLAAFLTTWVDRGFAARGFQAPRGPLRTGTFRWTQSLGLALVYFPFLKFAHGVWTSWTFLVDPQSVAASLSVSALYLKFVLHAVQYFVAPVAGLLLMLRKSPAQAFGDLRRSLALVMRRNGATIRVSWLHDAMHGLWLFAVFLVAYGVSLAVIAELDEASGGSLSSGSDEAVFSNMTVPLVFLLAIVAGVSEEFLFRGVLLVKVRDLLGGGRLGWWVSVGASSVFFGLIHAGYGTWTHVLGPLLFGFFEALVWLRYGLLPAIIIHIGIDIVAFGVETFDVAPWMETFLLLMFLASIAVPAVYFARLHRDRLKELGRRFLTADPG